jgi:hypothetical protein
VGVPAILLVIFGYAATFDVHHIQTEHQVVGAIPPALRNSGSQLIGQDETTYGPIRTVLLATHSDHDN